jgi:hypothetical protein
MKNKIGRKEDETNTEVENTVVETGVEGNVGSVLGADGAEGVVEVEGEHSGSLGDEVDLFRGLSAILRF